MDHDVYRRYLVRSGPIRSGALRLALRAEPRAHQRTLNALGDALHRTGRARARTVALRREVEGVRTPVDVYEMLPDGTDRRALTLHPLEPFGHYVEGHVDDVESGYHATGAEAPRVDLPWFLADLAPQGFLGRAWLRAHPDYGYPSELADWTGDDVLRYGLHHLVGAPGAFAIGPMGRDRARAVDARAHAPLVQSAEEAERAERHGSSPGGQQPKFTHVDAEGTHWLVKFTGPRAKADRGDTVAGRWADLLVAEHLAHRVLGDAGFAASTSRIEDAGGRRFLLVKRFDRHGLDGRSGLVCIGALDHDGVGDSLRDWTLVTRRLVDEGRLAEADHLTACRLRAFGQAIANTDMHLGNLSVRLTGTRITGLAPVYDMLPMAFAPLRSGLVPDDAPQPVVDERERFPDLIALARDYWVRVAADRRISDGFRRLAEQRGASL